jgi:hypothetical protein
MKGDSAMSEGSLASESSKPGTAAHFIGFLNWAGSRGEIPKATISNWLSVSKTVLGIEPGWEQLDLMTLDLEEFLSRFETLNRTKYKSDSMSTYKRRFQAAVESYRTWQLGKPDWKPATPPRSKTVSTPKAKAVRALDRAQPAEPQKNPIAELVGMIEVPVPLRPGVKATLVLPEDLKKREAQRISAVVTGLAFEEQLALPPGRAAEANPD